MAEEVIFLSTTPKYRIKLRSTYTIPLKSGGVKIEPGETIEFKPHHPGGEFRTSDKRIIELLRENKYFGRKGHFWEFKPTPVAELVRQKEAELEKLKEKLEEQSTEVKEEEAEDLLEGTAYNVEPAEEDLEPGKTFKYHCKKCSFKTNDLKKFRIHLAKHNFQKNKK